MSYDGFPRRRIVKPESPLKAVIECENYVTGGWVESLTLDSLYVRLKKHDLTMSKERVSVNLYLAASNGPCILRIEARIVQVDETGIRMQFRPMTLPDHTRLKAIIAFISPDQGPDASSGPD